MKRIGLLSLALLALSVGWLLFISQPSSAQAPLKPLTLTAQVGDPFGSGPDNVIPPDSPLRANQPNNPNDTVPPQPPSRNEEPAPGPPPPSEPGRDPTTVAPDIRAILDPPEETTNRETVPLPRLSGRVSLPGGRTMAVIAIGEEFTIVEEGDRIDFQFGNRGLESMEIVTLSPTQVVVKLEQMGRTVSLR